MRKCPANRRTFAMVPAADRAKLACGIDLCTFPYDRNTCIAQPPQSYRWRPMLFHTSVPTHIKPMVELDDLYELFPEKNRWRLIAGVEPVDIQNWGKRGGLWFRVRRPDLPRWESDQLELLWLAIQFNNEVDLVHYRLMLDDNRIAA